MVAVLTQGMAPDGTSAEPAVRRRAAIGLGQAAALLLSWAVLAFVALRRVRWSRWSAMGFLAAALVTERAAALIVQLMAGQGGILESTVGGTAMATLPLVALTLLLPAERGSTDPSPAEPSAGAAPPSPARPRWALAAWFVLGVIVGAGLSLGGRNLKSSPRNPEPPVVGSVAPDAVLELLDGGTWVLHDSRGHAVVLAFWATWCKPCRVELEALSRIAADMEPGSVEILAVTLGEPRDEVVAVTAAARMGLGITLASAGKGVETAFGIAGVPSTFLIDADGVVRVHHVGFGIGSEEALRAEIQALVSP